MPSGGCVLVFTGHRIDEPGRPVARLPEEATAVAAAEIEAVVLAQRDRSGPVVAGIAAGASGGDLLFHAALEGANIPAHLYLALPAPDFEARSVAPAGTAWVERFERTYDRATVTVLAPSADGRSLWQRANEAMIDLAFGLAARSGAHTVTLIALWNGEAGDGPGGTAAMVELARARGAEVVIIDPTQFSAATDASTGRG